MEEFRFDRVVRTEMSEVYYIYDDDRHIGELNLNILKHSPSHFLLVLDKSVDEVDESSILEQIDLQLSNDFDIPYFGYFINVYRGEFVGEYEVVNDE